VATDPQSVQRLSASQEAALQHVRSSAAGRRPAAFERIVKVLVHSTGALDSDGLILAVATRVRIALNFHPDRIAADGRVVAEAMLEDGLYRSQFETRISNGGLTAFPGGGRDRWEEAIFGGAYQSPAVAPSERPKYGGLNLMHHPDGPCPRFGSCHLRLRPEVLERSTFCFGDSHMGPRDVGTIDAFEPVLAALLEVVQTNGEALGRSQVSVQSLIEAIGGNGLEVLSATQGRALDDYIEAQVHGSVDLAKDAEAIIADPSFQRTPIGSALMGISRRYELDLTWHSGFELDVADVPAEFRGPRIPLVARRIIEEFGGTSSRLHAELIGRAARSVVTEPARWANWDTPLETLQQIKQLWHVLVRYGTSRTS
jgi:hypothetical protein